LTIIVPGMILSSLFSESLARARSKKLLAEFCFAIENRKEIARAKGVWEGQELRSGGGEERTSLQQRSKLRAKSKARYFGEPKSQRQKREGII